MSKTIKAIERHMVPRPTMPAYMFKTHRGEFGWQPRRPKFAEWQHDLQRVFAPASAPGFATAGH